MRGRNPLQVLLHGRHAVGFDRVLVHVGGVVVANSLRRSSCGGLRGGRRLDDLPDALLGQLVQLIEGAEAGAIGGDLEMVEPVATGIDIEVIARLDLRLARRQVETELADIGLRASPRVRFGGRAPCKGVTTAANGFSWAGLEVQAASVAASSTTDNILELDTMV